ncbi:sensor histidine kinase [Plantactinospora sp. GCM10030261]|uniref:sensor histidine kinase n=1 Tax=Plantactinospora sp. GCM10030261 TaxID=3273420 RepID=UPI00362139A5
METDGNRRVARPVLLAAVAATIVGALGVHLFGLDRPAGYLIALTAPVAVAYTVMGAVVLAGRPGHRMGRLMLGTGAVAALATVAASWSSWLPAAWLSQWSWWPAFGLIFLTLALFPDGRLPGPRWRPVVVLIVTGTAVATLALAVAAVDHPRDLLTEVIEFTPRAQLLIRVAALAAVVALAGLLGALWSLWHRWRRADGDVRRQLACLFPAVLVILLSLAVLNPLGIGASYVTTAVAVPVAMCVAILRYRLYGLDHVVNRSIVWLVMSLLVIAGFVAAVTVLREVLLAGTARAESIGSLVATGLVALAFEPARGRVQRGVDRLVYGDRDDPYRVIARLGDLLAGTGEPQAALPRLTTVVADSLRLPYVAVEVTGRDGTQVLAEHGRPVPGAEIFDLVARGERLGQLVVAPRERGGRLTRRERRLLGDVAAQAAIAVEATRLVRDLRDSRERLVMAREEERRRLRRDLHDGLGPTLAGMSMQVRAARKLMAEPSRADEILAMLADDLRGCGRELRRLVDQLRPPALDRGLADALRAESHRFDGPALAVRLTVTDDLAGLPAAVEVAAYRIAAEALTNVARHANATTCRITVTRGRWLTLEIVDDGTGIGATALGGAVSAVGGVGLDSMRDRAAELGGDCEIGDAAPHGTAVTVRLPLPAAGVPPPSVGAASAGVDLGVLAPAAAPVPADPVGSGTGE